MSTRDLDEIAARKFKEVGAESTALGYFGYPGHICVSVNDEVVHGIPGARVIAEGDLVSLDCGLILDGWWADSGLSVACGEAGAEARRLLAVTEEALRRGIEAARPGNRIGAIGHAVQSYVESQGFSVVRQYVGHGIGRNMHEPPQVPNYGRPDNGNVLKPGYVLAIEPMVNAGTAEVRVLDDQWTVVTVDKRWSCYFEHTVAVTEDGPRVLTRRPSEIARAAA